MVRRDLPPPPTSNAPGVAVLSLLANELNYFCVAWSSRGSKLETYVLRRLLRLRHRKWRHESQGRHFWRSRHDQPHVQVPRRGKYRRGWRHNPLRDAFYRRGTQQQAQTGFKRHSLRERERIGLAIFAGRWEDVTALVIFIPCNLNCSSF